MQRYFVKYRTLIIIASQASLLVLAYVLSFYLRFDFRIQNLGYRVAIFKALPLLLMVKLITFYFFNLYNGWWKYVGMSDLVNIIKASIVGSLLFYLSVVFVLGVAGYPRSTFLIDMVLTVAFIGGARFVVRAYSEQARSVNDAANTLIIGAGRAGNLIIRELKANPSLGYYSVGLIDDDRTKRGVTMQGVKVLGTTNDLPELIEKLDVTRILIAISDANGGQVQRIVEKCRASNVQFKILPPMSQFISGMAAVSQLRQVNIEDLLARDAVQLDLDHIGAKLTNRTILITGAGGSIGSELVRQVANFNPAKIILFERSENDLHKIDIELAEALPQLNYLPIVGDILDADYLREVIAEHRPQVIFHAAAYKHVPMMEKNCFQAVRNNVVGTFNLAMIADEYRVADFVMISTDKAVRPTNIMGVTKRVAELIILGLQHQNTKFVAVRFGNVLGSNGSVIPLFKEQLANRKPLTVTHPEVKRYFMTIPEATQLVLQASTMGNGGEIFVLDMGKSVKIVDLAENLIRLSGLEPGRDIPIIFTGLRPGEKLYEELMLEGEGIKPTPHQKIRVLDGGVVSFSQVQIWVGQLMDLVECKDVAGLVTKLKEIVPEYQPSKEILDKAQQAREIEISEISAH